MEKLKVYGLPNSTNTARVLVSLKEKGVDYQLIHVDILASAHKQHPFISLNIHSKRRNRLEQKRLNALVFVKYNLQLEQRELLRHDHHDMDPICLLDMESDDEWITEKEDPAFSEEAEQNMWMEVSECFATKDLEATLRHPKKKSHESRAINKYVAGKYKESEPDLLRYKSLAESAMVDVWLEVESQQFGPSISALVFEILIKPYLGSPTDTKEVEEQKEKLSKVLDIYEERLSKCRYLAGDYFTLADLNHLPHISNLFKTPMDSLITSRPHVFSWWQDISSRPAWKKIDEGLTYT